MANSARERWYKWRVRLLHDAAKQYLNTTDGTIYRETKRLFEYELSADDLQQLKEWDARMSAMVNTSSVDIGVRNSGSNGSRMSRLRTNQLLRRFVQLMTQAIVLPCRLRRLLSQRKLTEYILLVTQ